MAVSPHAVPPFCLTLFGAMDVQVNGISVVSGCPRKSLWLLAMLALRQGRPVPRRQLAYALWPETDESRGLFYLRKSLSLLRHALGPEAARLCSYPRGELGLDLNRAFVDVVDFDGALLQEGEATLEAAMALYRGPLLEGCGEDWALAERTKREADYARALETLAACAAQRGDCGLAAARLRQAIVLDPLREHLYRELMRVLAAEGSIGAVVQVYRELRLHLHHTMHALPSTETEALYRQLRAEVRDPANPARTLSVASPGSPPAPSRLPVYLTCLAGRQREMQEIVDQLRSRRLVTLVGPGGIGKTRLAVEVAACMSNEFTDGIRFVDLAAIADEARIADRISAALGPGIDLYGRAVESVCEFLREQHMLILLDNCEHLLEGCARIADRLLRECPQLHLLATSREALRLNGEQRYPLPPLSCPAAAEQSQRRRSIEEVDESGPPGLQAYEAVQLFLEHARMVRPDFQLTAQNEQAVARICASLEGLPLALELAAARLQSLSAEQIASRLDDRLRLLTGGSRVAAPRQRTLRASLDWSYELLTQPERILLRRLSVFVGGWTLEAAEAVCQDADASWLETEEEDEMDEPAPSCALLPASSSVLDLLASLVAKSLVVIDLTGRQARYRFLETVAQYALERLQQAGEENFLRQRHAEYFISWMEALVCGAECGENLEPVRQAAPDHDNLRAALAWRIALPQPTLKLPARRTGADVGSLEDAGDRRNFAISLKSPEVRDLLQRAVTLGPDWEAILMAAMTTPREARRFPPHLEAVEAVSKCSHILCGDAAYRSATIASRS